MRRFIILGIVLASIGLVLSFALSALAAPAAAPVSDVSGQLGGGRDLSITCASARRTFLFFGDTTSSIAGGDGPVMTDWRPLTGAFTTDRNPADGLTLQSLGGDGALLSPEPGAATITPTGCVVEGGVIYLRYMETLGNAGHDFQIAGAGVAVSADGAHWRKTPLWNGDTWAAQAALLDGGDGYVYALSSEGGRTGPAIAARVRPGRLQQAGDYQFWNGSAWAADAPNAAVVIDDTVGEMGLCHNGGDWLSAYMSPRAGGIVLRHAPAPQGP